MTTQANMNLVDKPSDKDFILPPLPPPPSDEFLLKQQKTSENKDAQFGISYKASHKATAVWQPTSPTSPNNTEFPPPPEDLPSPPNHPADPTTISSAKPFGTTEKSKGFRSVSHPVAKKPTKGPETKVENSTKVSIHGTPFPAPPGAEVEVTPTYQLPDGAVYQTTTKEGEVYHTDTYYPAANPGDPQSVVLERTKTTTLVKAPHHQGMGPTTGTGVPTALRTSVDDSKHWYKNMFKQMHKVDGVEDGVDTNGTTRPMSADSDTRHASMETDRPIRVGKITDYQPAVPYVVENKPVKLNLNRRQPPPPRSSTLWGDPPNIRRSSSLEDFSQQDWQQYFDDIQKPKSTGKIWNIEMKKKIETSTPPTPSNSYSQQSKMTSNHGNKQPTSHQFITGQMRSEPVKRVSQQRKSQGDGVRQPAKAKFDFHGRSAKELSLKRGQTVVVVRRVDDNWYMAESPDGVRSGIIPVQYLKLMTTDQPDKPTRHGQAKAKFDFNGKTKNELSFKKGDDIILLKRVDDNWYRGKLGSSTGILPVAYVEVQLEPEVQKVKKEVIPKELEVSPRNSHHSQQSSVLSQASTTSSEPDENERKNRAAFLAHSVVDHTPALVSNHHNHKRELELTDLDNVINQITTTTPPPEVHYDYPKPTKTSPPKQKELTPQNLPQMPSNPPHSTLTLPSVPSYPSSSIGSQPSTPRAPTPTLEAEQIVGRYVALYAYDSCNEDELDLSPGDVIQVVEICDDGWYVGSSEKTGAFGTFPGNYVTPTH